MDQTKSLLQSRTIWGLIVAALAALAQRGGITIGAEDQAQLVGGILDAANIAGLAIAFWGRVVARKAIGPALTR